jgi:hypothetical protein
MSNRTKLAAILPDIETSSARPHPDNLAWRKACPECAHRASDPQDLGSVYQERMMEFDGEYVFYCLHRRTEDNHDRICACYAAVHRIKSV